VNQGFLHYAGKIIKRKKFLITAAIAFIFLSFNDVNMLKRGLCFGRCLSQKEYLLSVMTIVKNEADIVDEWINHYIGQGVEHLFFIDNGSDDGLREKLAPYGDKVTLLIDKRIHQQGSIMEDTRVHVKSQSEWVLQVDMDEFVYARPSAGYGDTIASVLKDPRLEEVSAITMQWNMFGSSGHVEQPPSVRMNFTRCEQTLHQMGKYLIKSDLWTTFEVHHPFVSSGIISNQCLANEAACNYPEAVLILNHYPIMSKDRFEAIKMTRGDVYSEVYKGIRTIQYFKSYDKGYSSSECTELAEMTIAALE